MPEDLWTEVPNIVQDAVNKIIPKKKKWKKAKWLFEEVLQTAEKRKVKIKRKRERYNKLEAEFQRRARRDNKAFLSEQFKEIEENNIMGKTIDLFKRTGGIKRIFHAKIGTIKDKTSKDLTEVEDMKKRWQEYTELYNKKLLMTQITMM